MEKKWTYFISSTLMDLKEERQAVANMVLKLDEIPIGMEQFGAIDTSQWEYIKKLIDTSDYLILIIAGRYGTIDRSDANQISYTEKEFRYAFENSIPIIVILHESPESLAVSKSESNSEARDKLQAFRELASSGRNVAYYKNEAELIAAVASGISKAKSLRPRPGWVRSDSIKSNIEETEALAKAQGELSVMMSQFASLQQKLNTETALLETKTADAILYKSQAEDAFILSQQFKSKSIKLTEYLLSTFREWKEMDQIFHMHISYTSQKGSNTLYMKELWVWLFYQIAQRVRHGTETTTGIFDEIALEMLKIRRQDEIVRDGSTAFLNDFYKEINDFFQKLDLFTTSGNWMWQLTDRGQQIFDMLYDVQMEPDPLSQRLPRED